MKPTALPQITENLISPYLFKVFYPTKKTKKEEKKVVYFFEVKYTLKGDVPKGVSYKRTAPKQPSRRDIRRGNI